MRLEILVDSDEPIIFPLNKPEILIGSGESCDIVLRSSGVSRKHVKIIVDGDSYFVVDQGSTNGTFINEERLVPGRKTEFTSFFPVRLDDSILITLLSDAEAHDSVLRDFAIPASAASATESSPDVTRVLSLKDLEASSTQKLVKKRQEILVKKRSPPVAPQRKVKKNKDDARMAQTVFLVLVVFAAIGFYSKYYTDQQVLDQVPVVQTDTPVSLPADPVPVVEPPPDPEVVYQILQEDLIPREKLTNLFGDLKCLIPEELYFCDKIPLLKQGTAGVATIGSSLIFLVDQSVWYQQGLKLRTDHLTRTRKIKGANEAVDENVEKFSFYFFLRDALGVIDLKNYMDKDFYVVFYAENQQGPTISKVFAIKVNAIADLMKLFDKKKIDNYISFGPSVLVDMNKFYQAY